MKTTPLELLAPARDASIAIEAIKHGADAVYMGATSHGARVAARNSLGDLSKVSEFAHKFNARLYATVNTLVFEDELRDVERLIRELYRIGVDALIVQDSSILRLDIPPIALHASTQCDVRDAKHARFLQDIGFSQIVLPRELTLDEIRQIRNSVEIPLEAFVHGSLCVSYSGDCRAGFAAMGRSGNRGECPQMCRLPYNLIDGDGKRVMTQKHLLSLRDMNRLLFVGDMAEAGISSFKIEGRLKDMAYVKNSVTAYRQAIDEVIASSNGRFIRSSQGRQYVTFTPDLSRGFNRGFTDYFLHNATTPAKSLARFDTPKTTGKKIGRIMDVDSKNIKISLAPGTTISNGDGLSYFAPNGSLKGFRVNSVDKNVITLLNEPEKDLIPGVALYRNFDKEWEDGISSETAVRKMTVNYRLRTSSDNRRIFLDVYDDYDNAVTVSCETDILQKADREQTLVRVRTFSRTGDTIWEFGKLDDTLPNLFVPVSTLTTLRRKGLQLLEACRRIKRVVPLRGNEKTTARLPANKHLSPRDNVANSLARKFYTEHGALHIDEAVEVSAPPYPKDIPVMECRYCLRREIGACLKTPEGRQLKEPLTLDSGKGVTYHLKFDCNRCLMQLYV